mgnify:CR=1 FL=1
MSENIQIWGAKGSAHPISIILFPASMGKLIGDNNRWGRVMDKADKIYQSMLERLKKICEQKRVTYYFLAKSTGLSPSSISCLMRGKTKPYLQTILMICDAIDISIQELVQTEDADNATKETWLFQEMRQLSPEKQRLLEIYVRILREYDGDL